MPNQTDPNQTINPVTDIPPLPDYMNVPPSPTSTTPPADNSSGSAAPSDLPPVMATPKKKFGGGKIIATILGLVLLVGGVGAGVVLTQQQQIFNQKAAGTCSGTCICIKNDKNSTTPSSCGGSSCTCQCGSNYTPETGISNTCATPSYTTGECSGGTCRQGGCGSNETSNGTCPSSGSGWICCKAIAIITTPIECTSSTPPKFCGNCGTKICDSSGHFGPCTGEGCSPGNVLACSSGNGIKTCKSDCTWSSCSSSGGGCSEGTHQCSSDNKSVQICISNQWQTQTTCTDPTPTCSNGSCVGGGGTSDKACPPNFCTNGTTLNSPCTTTQLDTCLSGGVERLYCCSKSATGGTTKCPSPYSCLDVGAGGTGHNCSEPGYIPHSDYLCDANNDGVPDSNKICCEAPGGANKCTGIGCGTNSCTIGGQTFGSNCFVSHYWCQTRSPGGCSSNLIGQGSSEQFSENCGTEQIDVYCKLPDGTVCAGGDIAAGGKYLSKTYASDCGGGGTTTAPMCVAVNAYDPSWSSLSTAQLSALAVGAQVNFCVGGSAPSGTFDKAQFTINGVQQAETTTVRPGSTDFCQSYTILATDTTVSVTAKIHHSTLGWF